MKKTKTLPINQNAPKGVQCSDLLAALERSLRISEYVTAGTTVVKNIKHGGRKAQIQVRVTKEETDWYDIKRAGIKCS